ncbi:HlyC/CorC family transporter [Leucobacter sp. cx-42]|uniref:hemolysin family protein n=1 Tax=unclassified Leucobacter TaxID=2621730 RepID=UPI00165DFF4A|nr:MULTISPECIES: hemolysin family protein [unclassified Leucobacter]MBC9953546.1 HlyC/CorC family transporter [Leucobacter sp. cx-42]
MIVAALTLLLGVLLTLAIIVACGFFVAQEFAYMSVDRSRMTALAEKGDAQAQRVLAITKRTSFMLSGAQLGITVTGLMIGYVAEPLIGESLGTLLGGVGIDPVVSVLIGTAAALVLATVVTMIFGELYPKNLAIASPEKLARALAVPTRIYLLLFGWLITIFDKAANLLLRLLRIEPLEDVDESATSRDLEAIIDESRRSGHLSADLSNVFDRILDFPQRDVEHAMVPRSRVDAVPAHTTVGEIRSLMATGHTRYPVVGAKDEPVGLVELIDVLRGDHAADVPVTEIMRPVVIVPNAMRLPLALQRMRHTGNELVCVIDEYGTFDGILTVEDLTEEVIGELSDEHDTDAEPALAVGANAWQLAGDVHLDEVERLIGHDLEIDSDETVAGLLIREHGDLVPVGTRVRITLPAKPAEIAQGVRVDRWLEIQVTEVERHVPSLVIVELQERADDEASSAAESSAAAPNVDAEDEEVAR